MQREQLPSHSTQLIPLKTYPSGQRVQTPEVHIGIDWQMPEFKTYPPKQEVHSDEDSGLQVAQGKSQTFVHFKVEFKKYPTAHELQAKSLQLKQWSVN